MLHSTRSRVVVALSLVGYPTFASAIFTNTSTTSSTTTTVLPESLGVIPDTAYNTAKLLTTGGQGSRTQSINDASARSDTSNGSVNQTVTSLTGIALSSVISCASALDDYNYAAASWTNEANVTAITVTTLQPAQTYIVPGYGGAARTTQLCDHNPRVVGTAQITSSNSSMVLSASYVTYDDVTSYPEPYPTPQPNCSINMSDCNALYTYDPYLVNTYTPVCNLSTATESLSNVAPPFGTAPTATFGEGPAPTLNGTCGDCVIMAREAKLLYWPIRTKEGTGHMCTNPLIEPPVTLNGTRTGTAANSFVTDGVTIISPSVAISLTGISRRDGCYTTVASTIIPMDPEAITSIQGSEHMYGYRQFRFEDLNYGCQAENGSAYIADGPGANCYPMVPATAYFSVPSLYSIVSEMPESMTRSLTIADNYRPDIQLPSQLDEWASSAFGVSTCILSTCGVWDPPTALTEQPVAAVPTVPAQITTTRASGVATTIPATPAEPVNTHATPTDPAQSATDPTTTAGSPDPEDPPPTATSAGGSQDDTSSANGPPSGHTTTNNAGVANPTSDPPAGQTPSTVNPGSPGGGSDQQTNPASPTTDNGAAVGNDPPRETNPTTAGFVQTSGVATGGDGASSGPTSECGIGCLIVSGINGGSQLATTAQATGAEPQGSTPSSPESRNGDASAGQDPSSVAGTAVAPGSQQSSPGADGASESSGGSPLTVTSLGQTVSIGSASFTVISTGASSVVFANGQATTTIANVADSESGAPVVDAGSGDSNLLTISGQGQAVAIGSDTFTVVWTDASSVVIANGQATTTIANAAGSGTNSPAVVDVGSLAISNVVANGLSPVENAASLVTIGSQTFAVSDAGPSSVVIANAETTATLAAGASGILIGTLPVSALPSGELVVGSGSDRATITPAPPSPPSKTMQFGSDKYTIVASSSGNYLVAGASTTFTLSAASGATTIDGKTFSLGSNGVVFQSGSLTTTVGVGPPSPALAAATTVKFDSGDYTVVSEPDGTYQIVDGATTVTLSAGGSAATIDGITLSAGPQGVVFQSGSSRTTVSVGAQATGISTSLLDIGSEDYSIWKLSDGAYVVADSTTTRTLRRGGSAVTIGSNVVSAASGGLTVHTGTASGADSSLEAATGIDRAGGASASATGINDSTPTSSATPRDRSPWHSIEFMLGFCVGSLYLLAT